ncbi:MAG TPA: hypothetical protein EYP81_04525 [Thermodesulfobacteriaceae bacterium]|nr:hypothetical protein [Thermodesulfobacteriaceae bacterium]
MATIKKLVLDVLKPHQPNALEFALTLAEQGVGYQVQLAVTEMDEKTESTVLVITGEDIEFKSIEEAIRRMGASLHSIDEVEVHSGLAGDRSGSSPAGS